MQIDPARTAVIAVHVERDVIDPDRPLGAAFNEMVTSSNLVENLKELLDAAREAGATVVFPKAAFQPGYPGLDTGIALYAMVKEANVLVSGTDGVDVISELEPHDDDVQFEHIGTSAFVGGALEKALAERNVDTILVAGVATNNAVEGTARDASNREFTTYVVGDCCAAADAPAHEAALASLGFVTHGIVSSEEVKSALKGS